VQFSTAAPDAERERADRFAVDASYPRRGANTEAVTQGGDDFNLLVAGEDMHGANP
jgi:hypothetical protein